MAYELIYTSAPRGLQMGSSGFCTVAMSNGISPALMQKLESLAGYKPRFSLGDENYAKNPASYFHYVINHGGERFSLLGRVGTAGLDYSQRSNKLAHFLLPNEAEKRDCPGGPASMAGTQAVFLHSWQGEPQLFSQERRIAIRQSRLEQAKQWEAYAGAPAWAAWLAQSYLDNPKNSVFVIFDPLRHSNILGLVDESLQLLPAELRWKVTFNTYMFSQAPDSGCNWRFCADDPDSLRACGWKPDSKVLDLRNKLDPSQAPRLDERFSASYLLAGQQNSSARQSSEKTYEAAKTSSESVPRLSELRKQKAKQEEEERRLQEMRQERLQQIQEYQGQKNAESVSEAELRAFYLSLASRYDRLQTKMRIAFFSMLTLLVLSFVGQWFLCFYKLKDIQSGNENKPMLENAAMKSAEDEMDSGDVRFDSETPSRALHAFPPSITPPVDKLETQTDKPPSEDNRESQEPEVQKELPPEAEPRSPAPKTD